MVAWLPMTFATAISAAADRFGGPLCRIAPTRQKHVAPSSPGGTASPLALRAKSPVIHAPSPSRSDMARTKTPRIARLRDAVDLVERAARSGCDLPTTRAAFFFVV